MHFLRELRWLVAIDQRTNRLIFVDQSPALNNIDQFGHAFSPKLFHLKHENRVLGVDVNDS